MKKIIVRLLMVFTIFTAGFPVTVRAAQRSEEREIYGIGSVSKMFGAAAVMLLADRGLVELDAPVTDYIPEFEMADERYRQITVRMLLNHSSGIMGTTFQNCFLMGDTDTDYHTTLLEALKKQELKAKPGEYSVYCNDGYTLAEMVVERVSGKSFAEFIREEFSSPLGLQDTYAPEELTGGEALAPIYYNSRRMPYQNIQSVVSGGIYSTSEDLCRFARIFTENGAGILSGQAVEAMGYPEYQNSEIGVLAGDTNFGYGLGWDCVESYPFSRLGIPAMTKGGDSENYGTGLLVLPDQQISVAVTASGGSGELCLLMAQEVVIQILLEEGLISDAQLEDALRPAVDDREERAAIPEELKRFEGIYASGEIWKVEFTDDYTARVTCLENDKDMVQEYIYTPSGSFLSTEGKYISYNELAQASGGAGGLTSFCFSEEPNGKTYMMGTTYSMVNGRAQSAVTQPFGEKIEENVVTEEAALAWKARDGKKYYLISDSYNSVAYLKRQAIQVELMEALPGYTSANQDYKNCRIMDADNAVCRLELPIMTGRDLADYHFYRRDGVEYAEIGGYTYLDGEAIPDLSEAPETVTLGNQGTWFRVGEAQAGREFRIVVPKQGAYYVYDKEDECVTSSLLLGERETVLLPEGGKLLLAGEEGSAFTLSGRAE